ncbi:MAG TPA: hypothetical protein GX511_04320 [Firmicutes bacterium]|nr:hypothetical protein [Bacillota bacterium]
MTPPLTALLAGLFTSRRFTRARYVDVVGAIGSAFFFTAAILTLFLPRPVPPPPAAHSEYSLDASFTIRPRTTPETDRPGRGEFQRR